MYALLENERDFNYEELERLVVGRAGADLGLLFFAQMPPRLAHVASFSKYASESVPWLGFVTAYKAKMGQRVIHTELRMGHNVHNRIILNVDHRACIDLLDLLSRMYIDSGFEQLEKRLVFPAVGRGMFREFSGIVRV